MRRLTVALLMIVFILIYSRLRFSIFLHFRSDLSCASRRNKIEQRKKPRREKIMWAHKICQWFLLSVKSMCCRALCKIGINRWEATTILRLWCQSCDMFWLNFPQFIINSSNWIFVVQRHGRYWIYAIDKIALKANCETHTQTHTYTDPKGHIKNENKRHTSSI